MTLDNVQALPIGTQLGDFRLDAVIGHGSFGITYRAFDTQLAKVVAIKEYLPVEYAVRQQRGQVVARGARFADDFAWGRERFLDEARALARFRHPHIVPVLRYFEANGTAYMVMEFEDGRSLAELLHDGRQLRPEDLRRLAEGLLSGLTAVHEQGFLHRDIKPSNVMVRRDGVPVLIDFGAARQAMGNRTQTFTNVLTPQYAPIEQYALDGRQGPWSDIYSAAAVLHHAITGKAPAQAASRVGRDPYRPLVESEAGRYPEALLAAVDRGLAFDAADRPQTVAEWRALFGASLPAARDAATQRMPSAEVRSVPSGPMTRAPATRAPMTAGPRLGGVNREPHELAAGPSSMPQRPRGGPWLTVVLILLVGGGALAWRFLPEMQDKAAPTQQVQVTPQPATPTVTPVPTQVPPAKPQTKPAQPTSTPQAPTQQAPTQQAATQPATPSTPSPTPTPTPTPLKPTPNLSPAPQTQPQPSAIESVAQKALAGQAEHAASEGRAAAKRAKEASDTARSAAGEARIVAARAARPGLENAERLTYPNGASYVGQVQGGKRSGLGVADLESGERQIGEWKDDQLNGLGTVRLADGTRYEGQWVDGQSNGLGMRDKPGTERAEGNFAKGRLDGFAVRRVMGEQSAVQAGEFHGDLLDGAGTETLPNGERYEGEFRAGKRQGYGQVVIPDGKTQAGRWEAGQLVEQPAP
jgi:serine/threonine protein kinase